MKLKERKGLAIAPEEMGHVVLGLLVLVLGVGLVIFLKIKGVDFIGWFKNLIHSIG